VTRDPSKTEPDRDPAAGALNRLGEETSAYLLQHCRNPVDWYPWGDEALARARAEDKPLLVSIGYSACHWCHVMERESFEDPETAALMNRLFVCVKVDREERPDIDQIYMDTVVKLTGAGGWPLTVFCRPDGSPYYGGTYFPDEPRHGTPSFRQVLEAVSQAYHERRSEIDDAAEKILEALAARADGEAQQTPGIDQLLSASRMIMRSADSQNGGFGPGPKFPTPSNLEMLFCALDFLPQNEAHAVAGHLTATCRAMARRGLYDHLGGGFHRYCVDGEWNIPHFEKMLYDQGLLLRVYAEAWRRSTHPDEFLWPIRETVAYLRREMTASDGGYFASQDADSEGVEGAYNVWTPGQIDEALAADADAFKHGYDVSERGNFEGGQSHLIDVGGRPLEEFAAQRARLLAVRERRTPPGTDEKRVASWNGYAISGLARAGSLLDDPAILANACAAMDFVLDDMVDAEGRLSRIYNRGRASVTAFLDDHASLLDACLELGRAGAGPRFMEAALHFGDEIVTRFFDAEANQLYFTPNDATQLVHRPLSDHDGATPSAAGLATLGLLRLSQLSGQPALEDAANRIIEKHAFELERVPHAQPTLMRAVALRARGLSVALVVGDAADPATTALALRARRILLPDDAVLVVPSGTSSLPGVASHWLEGRDAIDQRPTAYVCRGRSCSLPTHDPAELRPLESAD